jgi:alkanesulfonate monooxygenase SsuD/methylene tetrahydromethanopterin reductase-like flavin-dependent oxidoreductase (luciferase family)
MAGPIHAFLSDDPERDWPAVAPHVRYQWTSYGRYGAEGTGRPAPEPIDPDEWRARGPESGHTGWFLFDTPEEVAARILRFVGDAPVETVFLWGTIAGLDEQLAERNVELICTRLAPLLA